MEMRYFKLSSSKKIVSEPIAEDMVPCSHKKWITTSPMTVGLGVAKPDGSIERCASCVAIRLSFRSNPFNFKVPVVSNKEYSRATSKRVKV